MSVFGLPSPIVLGLAADLLLQIFLLGLLALPLGLRRLRRLADRRFPLRRTRYLAVASLLCIVALLRFLVAEPARSISTGAEQKPCTPLESAQALGLEEGAIVFDPRPPISHAAYHLEGSCRRRITSLGDVAAEHPGATVYVVDDTEFPQHALEEWVEAGIDARPLPGGLQAHYKPNGSAFGLSPAPNSIVSAGGAPVAIQLGPIWFMGEQHATRALRQRPEAEAASNSLRLVDLRDHGGTVPAYDAYPDRLTAPSLLLCDDPPSCLAADALGVSSPFAAGKIRTLRSLDSLQSAPAVPAGAFWVVLLLIFMSTLVASARVPRGASWLAPTCALGMAFVAPRYLSGAAFVYGVDAPWLSPLLALLVLVWLARHESAAGRASTPLRLGVALSVVALAFVELFGQGSGGLHSAAVGAFCAALAGLLVVDVRSARALFRPLRFADAGAGGKAARLAEVLARGVPVPPGIVVYDGYQGDLTKDAPRHLGSGPYIVRSSAEGEDAPGGATAGRYHSQRDVDAASLPAAVKAVRAAYPSGAVLVQRQLEGELAGVAEDAPLDLIRVEAASVQSADLLDGEGASVSALVSAASGWGDAPFAAGGLVQCHDRAGEAVQSEWVLSRGRLWFVQVRDVDPVALRRPEASLLVRATRAAWVTDPEQVVLDGGGLGDYDGASNATLDLMSRLFGDGPWRDEAEGILGIRLPRPEPAIVRVGGRLYSNRVPPRPVVTALSLPWRRVRLWWLRRRRSAALARVHAALASAAKPGGGMDDAAPPLIAVSLLGALCDAEPVLAGDPYLEALSRGALSGEGHAAGNYPGRAMPDLALRLAREGRAPLPDVPPLGADFKADLAVLRGVARRLFAHHISEYRTRPGLDLREEPVEALPLTLSLPQLERYALDGAIGVVRGAQTRGIWIGQPAPGEYTVGETLVLIDVPTPQRMAAAGVEQILVAQRGSRLCHGALVAKDRGVRALFSVGHVEWPDGAVVTLEEDGTYAVK